MNSVPVILRAKIARAALLAWPRGMSRNQVRFQVPMPPGWHSAEVGALLDAMVRDGILARQMLARPFPRDPIPEYVASDALRKGGGS